MPAPNGSPNSGRKMIDEGLVDTTSATWSDRWKRRVGTGTIASVFSGAWMPSLLLSNVPGAAGLWRVAPMPTYDGQLHQRRKRRVGTDRTAIDP